MKKLLFVFAISVCFAACPPPGAKRAPVKKLPKAKQEEVREKPKDYSRPKAPEPVITPQRTASDRLIEKGEAELKIKNYERAQQIFQDAANIDSSNGVAFYYLAESNLYLEQPQIAQGLLDKAESLLRYDKDWLQKIEELRIKITGEKSPVTPLPPVIDKY